MYFETSKDILYLVISFCILWVTVFLCWMLYYVMRILRNANEVVEEFRTRLTALMETINYIRGKVEAMSGMMSVATGGLTGLVKNVVAKKAKKWVHEGTKDFDSAAKDAVEMAVEAAAQKMKKAAKKIKQ